MPKIPIDKFKYYFIASQLAKQNSFTKGYFLGLDLGTSVFGSAVIDLANQNDARPYMAKDSMHGSSRQNVNFESAL